MTFLDIYIPMGIILSACAILVGAALGVYWAYTDERGV